VPTLANAGPYCDPCGKPLKFIAQSKKGLTFCYIDVSLDEKLKWFIFIMFLYFNQAISQMYYLFNLKKLKYFIFIMFLYFNQALSQMYYLFNLKKLKWFIFIMFLYFNQAISQMYYLFNLKKLKWFIFIMFLYFNQTISQMYYLFNLKKLNQLFCTLITKSVREICMVPHCIFKNC
jgi:hypothetical protein